MSMYKFKALPQIHIEHGASEATAQVLANHLNVLIGRRIESIQLTMFEDSPVNLVATLVFDDGSAASIMADPEGNGPGHIEILPPEGRG